MAYILEWIPGLVVLWLWWKSRRMEAQLREVYGLMAQLRSAKDIQEFDALLALVRECAGRNDGRK